MTAFPGQLTTLGLNASFGQTWTITPFYLQIFLQAKIKACGQLVGFEP